MDTQRPGSGFFQNNVHKELLQAMIFDDENKFNQLLNGEDVNVNKVYDKGSDYGTLLDLCCLEGSRSKFIATLLNRGANPNLINSRMKNGPIHQLAKRSDSESMKVLLAPERDTDPNLLDNFGDTALHIACKNNDIHTVNVILQHPDTNVNISNRKGKTPLHFILSKEPSEEYVDVVRALLSHPNLDLSITDSDDIPLRQTLEESYPELINDQPSTDDKVESNLSSDKLFQLLRRGNYAQFEKNIKGNRETLEGDDGSYTFLQYCCEYGVDEVIPRMLEEGVDPNKTCANNTFPPVMIATRKGYLSIVKVLVDCKRTSFHPVNNETVLHCLVNGGYEKQGLSESNIERNHFKCLSYVLKKVPQEKLNVNYRDKNGNTALHYAAKFGDQNIVLELLGAGAYIGVCNKLNEPSCADITQATMKRHLDNCIYTNDKMPRDEMFALTFNYSCLMPFNTSRQRTVISDSTENFIGLCVSMYDKENKLGVGETDPLIYMSRNVELRPLLTHPIFTSYLHLKWHKIKPYYFANLLFYFLFWFFLTYYILAVFIASPTEENHAGLNPVTWFSVFIFLIVLIIREAAQFILSPIKYLKNVENWLELGIITITILVLSCGDCTSIKHQLSAVGILASWAELVLLIGKHPSLSTNIEMFKTVSWNFLKFLAWYSILIVAFALCFYTLFKDAPEDDNQFQHPGVSVFKTVVMLTGEFDSGSIPFLIYPVTSHILFMLFVFLIAIVLLNLLNGLAVSDTQVIKADAELVGYISQAKLISYIEEILSKPSNCWGLFRPNLLFSNKINMFQDIPNGQIQVYPNNNNTVEYEGSGLLNNRKNISSEGCYEADSITMDSRIVKTARNILAEKEQSTANEVNLSMIAEKEKELRQLLGSFREVLAEFKDINQRMKQKYQ